MNVKYLKHNDGYELAYHYTPPAPHITQDVPQIVFLGGFKSDMNGTKALYLEEFCRAQGYGFVRLDYSGHGQSKGAFEDGNISRWKNDALEVIDSLHLKNILLIGSSMGGWISLRIALERPSLVYGFIGIAAAPDFTDDIWYNRLNDVQRAEILQNGKIAIPNEYDDTPYIITKALIEDGRENFILNTRHDIQVPMIMLQGMRDPDVPWETTSSIKNAFPQADIDVVLIEDGDHRLSRPEDLEILGREIKNLILRGMYGQNSF